MPNYIDDDTALPAARVDRRAILPGESETRFYNADFGNAILQFCEDARDAIQTLQSDVADINASNIWDLPLTADASDDEFENVTLDASWLKTGTWDNTAVDPYSSPSAGHIRYQIHTDRRRSWLTLQAAPDSTSYFLYKALTFNTNDLIWARMSFSQRQQTSPSNNDGNFMLMIGDGASFTNNVAIKIVETDAGIARIQMTTTGGSTISSNDYWTTTGDPVPVQGVALHKVGTSIHAWVMDSSGQMLYVGTSGALGWTPTHAGFVFANVSSSAPGANMMSIDFFRRVRNSATYLPGP